MIYQQMWIVFFEGADKVENKRKTMVCPHCGKEIEL